MIALKGKKVFIVEDNVNNLSVYAVTLKRYGARVIQDFWNVNTINILKNNMPVDVILLDLMLQQGKSGYDIFDEIKRDPSLANIPVAAVSASDSDIEIPKTQSKGFDGFIAKPISIQEFPKQIENLINGQKLWIAG